MLQARPRTFVGIHLPREPPDEAARLSLRKRGLGRAEMIRRRLETDDDVRHEEEASAACRADGAEQEEAERTCRVNTRPTLHVHLG